MRIEQIRKTRPGETNGFRTQSLPGLAGARDGLQNPTFAPIQAVISAETTQTPNDLGIPPPSDQKTLHESTSKDAFEKWWEKHMPNQTNYTIEDLWNGLRKKKRKNNINVHSVANFVSLHKKDLGVSGKRLPGDGRLQYEKKDAKRIMKALLARKTKEGSKKDQDDALHPRVEEEWKNLTLAERQKILDKLKEKKQELFAEATEIILSHINSLSDINYLEENLSTFLTEILDSPIYLYRNFSLAKEAFIPFLVKRFSIKNFDTFFIDSFAQNLEKLWNKGPELAATGKGGATLEICQSLKANNWNVPNIVKMVCDYFDIELPEIYQLKTA